MLTIFCVNRKFPNFEEGSLYIGMWNEGILPINCMRIWAPRVLESGRPQYGILGAHSLNCGWLNFSRFSHYLQGQFALPMHDNLSSSHVGHFHTTTHPPNMVRKINHHYEFRHPQFELLATTVYIDNLNWINPIITLCSRGNDGLMSLAKPERR